MHAWLILIILAVVQGATEFLPVSSSGHLSLGHAVFGSGGPDVLVDVVLHVGTLIAVVGVYRRDVAALVAGALRGLGRLPRLGLRGAIEAEPGFAMSLYVIGATMVTGVIGLTLEDAVESTLRGPAVVGGFLLLNGVILWSSLWSRGPQTQEVEDDEDMTRGFTWPRVLMIGLLQGLAVTPGISRSGLTITGALHMGIDGSRAARFSFVLSIPAILGALVLKLGDVGQAAAVDWTMLITAAVVAGAVGWLALVLLIKVLDRARFHHFAWYCWALGAVAISSALW